MIYNEQLMTKFGELWLNGQNPSHKENNLLKPKQKKLEILNCVLSNKNWIRNYKPFHIRTQKHKHKPQKQTYAQMSSW